MSLDFLKTLNPQQREAVTTTDGPLLVLAGAGSGKTRVITFRMAYLIQERGIRPGHILAVTFTNKAAAEMKERVTQLLPQGQTRSTPMVSTFHSFCVRLLRRDINRLGGNYTGDFTIYDSDDQAKIVKNCLKDLNIDEKMIQPRAVQHAISGAKNQGKTIEDFLQTNDPKKVTIGRVFKLYEERLANGNALDFDDLLLKSVRLLRNFPEVQDYYNDWFKYILIDEYQDTNPPQYSLIRLLTQKQQNLCVVGDPDQSIYRFRAADIRNILDFEKHYPGAKMIKLTENYRSTKVILSAANEVIRNNTERKPKDLFTNNDEGEKIRYFQADSGEAEAAFVVNELNRWQKLNPHIDNRAAILYRTNAQSRLFEEACRRAGLPYVLVGGFSFYQRSEIKDVISYLKLVLNPTDPVAFERIINTPARGIGKATLDILYARAREENSSPWDAMGNLIAEQKLPARTTNALKHFQEFIQRLIDLASQSSLSELVKAVLNESGYLKWLQAEKTEEAESRLLNLEELVNAAVEAELRDETIRDFIDHAALVADTDSLKETAKITLMTIHSAKGLEFPIVFVVGMEEGLFPHQRASMNMHEMEEERRLCYVALTRAKTQLYITHAEWRRQYGEEIFNEPSRFLKEIPTDKITDLTLGQSWLKSISRKTPNALSATASTGLGPKSPAKPPVAPPKSPFPTYNSVDSIQQFFKLQQARKAAEAQNNQPVPKPGIQRPAPPPPPATPSATARGFNPGDRVRHEKYGVGLILKREDDKLVINFPGFGMKKFVESAVKLERV